MYTFYIVFISFLFIVWSLFVYGNEYVVGFETKGMHISQENFSISFLQIKLLFNISPSITVVYFLNICMFFMSRSVNLFE